MPTDTDRPPYRDHSVTFGPSTPPFRPRCDVPRSLLKFRDVAADRYGGLVTTAASLPGRISGFVRWVVRTPWPLFSLSMLQADIIGALFVLGFLRYALPPEDRIQLQDLPILNVTIFASTLIILFLATWAINLKLLMPVFRWQRRDILLVEA